LRLRYQGAHEFATPEPDEAFDQAAEYFNDTYSGRMVHVTGLASVVGAVLADIFTREQRAPRASASTQTPMSTAACCFSGPISSRRGIGRRLPS
jgi:hypothetical protein